MDFTLLGYDDLVAELNQHESFCEAIRHELRHRAVAELRRLDVRMRELKDIVGHDAELVLAEPKPAKQRVSGPVKYRDPVTGKTWTGRGKHPKWFDASQAELFLIAG